MRISFFEEFPIAQNLSKLKQVHWPTNIYLAAPSLNDFKRIKSKIKNKNVKEIIYWPILSKKEGYWISPFSDRNALLRTFVEITQTKTQIMIDAELPTTQNPRLYITQLPNFFRNRSLIQNFIKKRHGTFVVEYYPEGKCQEMFMQLLGLHFNPKKYRSNMIRMIYHSMHVFDEQFLTNEIKVGQKECKGSLRLAYGTISPGIHGTEPILAPEQLERDLIIAKRAKIKEVIIFRLGGLNKIYRTILEKFT